MNIHAPVLPQRSAPGRASQVERRTILGVGVWAVSKSEAIADILSAIKAGQFRQYAFLNAHGSNLARMDKQFRERLERFVIFPDGFGVDIASRWLHGTPFPANLNGTDFVPSLLAECPPGTRIGLLGAAPGVADKAVERLARTYPHLVMRTVHHGFFDDATRAQVLDGLARNPVDVLLVALGNPHQETFIDTHVTAAHTATALGVGALFDFLSRDVPRAPKLLRRLRLEWAFRLAREPRRLWRRYLIGNPVFLARVVRARLQR